MNRKMLLASAIWFMVWSVNIKAEEPALALGERGKLLLDEKFPNGAQLDKHGTPKGWAQNSGRLEIVDNQLRIHEISSEKHAAAFRYRLPVQDCAVQFDFKLGGVRFLHFGYDPAPGELKKKGHLFSVAFKADGWSLLEHNDKSDPDSKQKVLANKKISLDPEKTYTAVIECRGDKVAARIVDVDTLEGTSSDFHVKKPGLVFRVSGDETRYAFVDNVRVWELK